VTLFLRQRLIDNGLFDNAVAQGQGRSKGAVRVRARRWWGGCWSCRWRVAESTRVISSRQKAPIYGGGLLLVDGTDTTVHRKAEFAFTPSRKAAYALDRLLVSVPA
jgi:hypothetical protein